MTNSGDDWEGEARALLERDGYVVLPAVYEHAEAVGVIEGIAGALAAAEQDGESIRSSQGSVYAARNILTLYPPACSIWRKPRLLTLLMLALGPEFGLVRGLYFDKPPERTWSLPWHKDRTIAVRDNSLPSAAFQKPTRKAGVPHIEAPPELLAEMLTLRIHLDDMTEDNGPLKVAPGSHREAEDPLLHEIQPRVILGRRGDVLAMRPLLSHCSGQSAEGTQRHRRVLHLEFAARRQLPDGFAWNMFFGV